MTEMRSRIPPISHKFHRTLISETRFLTVFFVPNPNLSQKPGFSPLTKKVDRTYPNFIKKVDRESVVGWGRVYIDCW